MVQIGYTMRTQQAGPRELVRHAVGAEQASFDFSATSDHCFFWLAEQGHSPFAWSVPGTAAQATTRLPPMAFVTCPTGRYHPAVVAQKAATVQPPSEGRFRLGLGSGENLDEHIAGEGGGRPRTWGTRGRPRPCGSSGASSPAAPCPAAAPASAWTGRGCGTCRAPRPSPARRGTTSPRRSRAVPTGHVRRGGAGGAGPRGCRIHRDRPDPGRRRPPGAVPRLVADTALLPALRRL